MLHYTRLSCRSSPETLLSCFICTVQYIQTTGVCTPYSWAREGRQAGRQGDRDVEDVRGYLLIQQYSYADTCTLTYAACTTYAALHWRVMFEYVHTSHVPRHLRSLYPAISSHLKPSPAITNPSSAPSSRLSPRSSLLYTEY